MAAVPGLRNKQRKQASNSFSTPPMEAPGTDNQFLKTISQQKVFIKLHQKKVTVLVTFLKATSD